MLAKRRFIVALVVILVISISPSMLPAQSNGSVLAIVGARIVDGSGNEPFDGTVVVRDGRIAEVGRSVRPPEGARIVEAHGRTVTPGFIDVRVHLPANANAADAAVARVMAAYLYAGVTTIGVVDLDEGKVDTLRDRLAISRIRAPRLVAATAPQNAMLASTLGNAVPDAAALADWKNRNATLVPELLLAGASDRKVALDRLRAAQQAGVRIAVGSNTGATDLAPGTSTLRELRMLVEGGLTPLQALTAVTSGSAWALGLQSDRAFLAVGQRGDLAILKGDLKTLSRGESGALPGDGELVEQVFVGGEEIDRAALNAIITGPETRAPESTSAANAGGGLKAAGAAHAAGTANVAGAANVAGVGRATGAEGASGAAPVKSAAKSGKAAAGRAGRKGRGRSKDAADATTTEAGAGAAAAGVPPDTAASATPNGTTTAAPTLNTNAPPGATGTSSATGAKGATGAAAGKPASASASTATTSASAGAAASGSAAVSGAATASAAGAASGAAAAGAPIPLAEPLIDDFESGGDQTDLGTVWNASNDSGSTTDVIVGRVVRGLRDHALHLTARMGDTAEPYARVTVSMVHDGRPADVSQFHGLRFEARGQGRYRVVFVTRSVTDGRYHESFFSGSPLWTPVSIPFGTLGQASGGQRMKWTGTDLLEIAFQFAREPGQIGWLELDNLRFY